MRTKTMLLTAAAIAAGALSSMAQSNVYSLNIVGYVNVPVAKGKAYMLSNPFDTGTGNNITNVLLQPYFPIDPNAGGPGVAGPSQTNDYGWDGTFVYAYTPGSGYGNGEQYVSSYGWYPGALTVNPGTGYWFISQTNGTVTFTGSVTLNSTNTIAHGLNLAASAYPAAASLQALGLFYSTNSTTGHDGDYIYRWYAAPSNIPAGYTAPNPNGQEFGNGVAWIDTYGWYDYDAPASSNGGGGGGPVGGPTINPGEGFAYINGGTASTWTQAFTVN